MYNVLTHENQSELGDLITKLFVDLRSNIIRPKMKFSL